MKLRYGLIGVGIFILLSAIFVYGWCFNTIPKGHVGVLSWFGNVQEGTLEPGPHLIHPFKTLYKVNIQTQKNEEPASVPTSNGLIVEMKATMLYHLDKVKLVNMLKEIGHDGIEEKIIDPIFKAAVRDACATYPAEALYTADREKVEGRVMSQVLRELDKYGVIVEQVMLLDPKLPEVVKARIEQKVGSEQDVARMEFVLKQKELEAKAKVVEAKGIADSQMIIKKDLDDNYLRYLWIEALKHHSGAVIYVPTGTDGMPFFKPVHKP